jgi:hypothetical protein
MKRNYINILLLILSLCLMSCKTSLEDKIDFNNYKEDLKSLIKEDENVDILMSFNEKKYISPVEYKEMINYLSNKDSLMLVKDFAYFNILFRIKQYERIKLKDKFEKKAAREKEELAKTAIKTDYVTIYFRDTKQEVEKKLKMDADSLLSTFYIRNGEKDYRIHLGDCKPYFAYSKGYGDDKERLDYFSITLDIHAASTYKDYYVGETKYAYDKILKYFESLYGKVEHYYPDLSSYSSGYGDRFTVAEWKIGETNITIEIYEKRELWDKYGDDSYKTKYVVEAALGNFDKDLRASQNE